MDRTKEFFSIVELTEIPQNAFEQQPFFEHISKTEREIDKTCTSLSRLTSYESFRAQTLLSRMAELLREYKDTPIVDDGGSKDCQEVLSNLRSMVNTKFLKYTLKLNEMRRRLQREALESSGAPSEAARRESSASLLLEEQEHRQENEFVEERKRIVKSINEIGQIVEDISIHVRLQEEQLRRVDDIVVQSDRWSKKALSELNDIWFMVRSNRRAIVKFFAFWLLIVLLFWVLRKV